MFSKKSLLRYLFVLVLISLVVWYVLASEGNTPKTTPVQFPPTATVAGITVDVVTPVSETAEFPVYFTSPVRPYKGQKDGGIENHLIDLIDNAKTSVDAAVFEFDLEDVTQALIRAKERGVLVRVVYDNEYSDPDPQMGKLSDAGIVTIPDDRSAYMHNKFFVFDSYCVWTGSFNISVNAAFKNNENAIVICDQNIAENYGAEFVEMFGGSFGPKSPSDTPHPRLTVEGVSIENYFAPEDKVMSKIIAAVSESKKSVHFMAFSFTDNDLSKTMIDLMDRGVEVAGIFESRGATTASSECNTLVKSNARIGLDGNPYTFHHKVIIVDGSVVIFGSFNFTANANEQNDENLLVIYSSSLAEKFEQEFQSRLAESNPPINGECVSK